MKANRFRMLSCILLFVFLLWVLPGKIYAQEKTDRNGFVLGGWAGYGQINVNADNTSRSSYGTFALGFKGGYAITSTAIIGLELNGWTLKGYNNNDPSKGESVSNISLFANYFPLDNLPLYVAGGVGQVSYTNNSPGVNGRDKGGSWFIGSGYEIQITNKVMLVPHIRYSQGNITGGNFRVYKLALGINWYSGKLK